MADIKSPRTVWILHIAYLLHGHTGPGDVRHACLLAVAMLLAIIPEQLEYLRTTGCSTSAWHWHLQSGLMTGRFE